MATVKPGEVSEILRQQLEGLESQVKMEEVGTVLQVGDGIARIYGLSHVQANELIEFENGVTANLTMHGFSDEEGRTLRIDGTKATLTGKFNASGEQITIKDHFSGLSKIIYKQKLSLKNIGHGGGDMRLIDAFIKSVIERKEQPLTNAMNSLESHLMAFAAEESRLKNIVIDMEDFRKQALDLI